MPVFDTLNLLDPDLFFVQAASNMQQFMRSNALSPMVMVCTDRSSRGMDFDRAEASVFVCVFLSFSVALC